MRELEFQVSHHGVHEADRVPRKKKDIDEIARNGGGGGTQKTQIYTAENIIF